MCFLVSIGIDFLSSNICILDMVINVKMAEVKTAKSPKIFTTFPLGSCVAVMLYDKMSRIGSIAHIMLPDIKLAKSKINKAKFANTAVEIMLKEMIGMGATKGRIKAKITGGANMFSSIVSANTMHIGLRNVAMVKAELKKRKIRLVAEDTEENYSRSVEFILETGMVRIKSALRGIKEI